MESKNPRTAHDFQSLYTEHYPYIKRYFIAVMSDEDVQDYVHDTFLALFCALSAGRCPENVRAWLIGTAKHIYADYVREKKKYSASGAVLSLDEDLNVEGLPGINDWTFVGEMLDPLDQRIILMFYRDKMSTEEIARRLNIPDATCRKRIERTKKKFKKQYPNMSQNVEKKRLYR